MATNTASFGAGKREGHDASAFYARRVIQDRDAPAIGDVGPLVDPPAAIIDRVFCQSSTSMEQIPDNCVALMVTSPPYNVGKEYDDDLNIDEYLSLLRRVFTESWRVIEPGGRVAVNVANIGRKPYIPLNHHVAAMLTDIGFNLRGEIIWQKAKSAGGSCAWGSWMSATNPTLRDVHEYVVVASKGPFARVRAGTDTISKEEFLEATISIWDILPESARRIGHPAPFPVELPRRLIELYTFEGDLVLDPFLGSGTTAVAAVETHRHYVGYDVNREYVALAEKRIRDGAIGRRGSKA